MSSLTHLLVLAPVLTLALHRRQVERRQTEVRQESFRHWDLPVLVSAAQAKLALLRDLPLPPQLRFLQRLTA